MPSSAATGGFPEDTHARGLRHGSGSGSGSAKKPTSLSATLRHRASGSPPTGSCARQYRWLEEVAPILERKLSWPRMLFPVALFLVPVLSLASCVVSSEPGGQAIRQLQTERLGSWLPGPPDALGTRQSRAARLCSSNPTRPRVVWSGRSFLRGGGIVPPVSFVLGFTASTCRRLAPGERFCRGRPSKMPDGTPAAATLLVHSGQGCAACRLRGLCHASPRSHPPEEAREGRWPRRRAVRSPRRPGLDSGLRHRQPCSLGSCSN